MKDLLLSVHVVAITINLEISRYFFDRLRQKMLLKCVPHVQHDYISPFNNPIKSLFSGAVVPVVLA